MRSKSPAIPGFTTLSDQVFLREGSVVEVGGSSASDSDPQTVLIYGWGDGQAKHVVKYAEGYRHLFPHARQVIVLSPIRKAMFSDLRQRSEYMLPVLEIIDRERGGSATAKGEQITLVHSLSNTGLVNYATTLNAYQKAHGEPLPHQLLIMDSTPGNTSATLSNVMRFARAMAIGSADRFPWPFAVTQCLWFVLICIHGLFWALMGREVAGEWSQGAVNDEKYETKKSRKLYMYSKEDELISWQDINLHVAEARARGWKADLELFRGSNHVGHMRQCPEQYWTAVGRAWRRAIRAKHQG